LNTSILPVVHLVINARAIKIPDTNIILFLLLKIERCILVFLLLSIILLYISIIPIKLIDIGLLGNNPISYIIFMIIPYTLGLIQITYYILLHKIHMCHLGLYNYL